MRLYQIQSEAREKKPHTLTSVDWQHISNTKQLFTPLKIQDPRSQWHGDLEATTEHYPTPNKLSTKLCQQDGEICWQDVIMNQITPLPKNADQHLLPLNRFSILRASSVRREVTLSLPHNRDGQEGDWIIRVCVYKNVCTWVFT